MENKKPDYEGFGKHIRAWDEVGAPYGTKELMEIAELYGTPIPGSKEWHEEFPPVKKENNT